MDCWMKIRKWQLVYKLDSLRDLVRERKRGIERTRERELLREQERG